MGNIDIAGRHHYSILLCFTLFYPEATELLSRLFVKDSRV